jgi:hypothetical protein
MNQAAKRAAWLAPSGSNQSSWKAPAISS